MCYFGTGLLWSILCCNLNARPSVYHQKGARRGRCIHLTTVMGTKEKAPWATCMQSKNKNSPFLKSPKSFGSYLFLFCHWFLSVPPALFECPFGLWSCILMLEGGRWQIGNPQMSSLQLDPGSRAGRLCWEKVVLEMSRWSSCGNTSCRRNPPLTDIKRSCIRAIV